MKNIGKKIMTIGKIEFFLGVLCLIGSVIAFINYEEEAFMLLISLGASSILTSFPIIGFGQLVDDVHVIRETTENK